MPTVTAVALSLLRVLLATVLLSCGALCSHSDESCGTHVSAACLPRSICGARRSATRARSLLLLFAGFSSAAYFSNRARRRSQSPVAGKIEAGMLQCAIFLSIVVLVYGPAGTLTLWYGGFRTPFAMDAYAAGWNQFENGCTLSKLRCFNPVNCLGGVSAYVDEGYGEASIWSKQQEMWGNISESLRSSKYASLSRSDACLVIVSGAHSLLMEAEAMDPWAASHEIRRRPGFGNGRNHVSISMDDFQYNQLDLGMAIVMKSSLARAHFRPGFDISLPLIWDEWDQLQRWSRARRNVTPQNRPTFVAFKGKFWFGRSSLKSLMEHSRADGKIVVVPETSEEHDYVRLMQGSKFCLCPAGHGYGSRRLLESMAAGCIPVISYAETHVLPFESLLDWRKFSILMPRHASLDAYVEILSAIPPKKVEEIHATLVRTFDLHFSSVRNIFDTALGIIDARLRLSFPRNDGIRLLSSCALSRHEEQHPYIFPIFEDTCEAWRSSALNDCLVVENSTSADIECRKRF